MDINRRAIVRLSPTDLMTLLDLPQGLSIIAVHGDFDPPSIAIAVVGDALDEVPEGAFSPPINGSWVHEDLVITPEMVEAFPALAAVEGKRFRRWGWQSEEG